MEAEVISLTLWDVFKYAQWSGLVIPLILLFYSIPIGILGMVHPARRSAYCSKLTEVCKIIIAIFFAFSALHVVHFFDSYRGLDGPGTDDLMMPMGSSLYLASIAIIITKVISILLMTTKKNSNQNMDPIVTTPVDKVEAQSTQGHV